MFLVLVIVFVKFPQEGSGVGSYYLEENFTLEEYVEFFSIEVFRTPCVGFFSKGE